MAKAAALIDVTLLGMVTEVSWFIVKAPTPIDVTLLGMATEVSWFMAKALPAIDVTLLGIATEADCCHKKRRCRSTSHYLVSVTNARDLLANALSPITFTAVPPITAGISTSLGQAGLAELLPWLA